MNLDATAPTVFAIMVFMMWSWWSVYLSGELKSASNRGRQLSVMFGGLLIDGRVHHPRAVPVLQGHPVRPATVAQHRRQRGLRDPERTWYQFLATLVQNIPVLALLILGSFLFWSLPAMVGNTFMPIRTVFAWAFDRLLPEKFADVNERTHSPVPAILLVMGIVTAMLAWSILSTDFGTWLALGVLAGVVCVVIVAVAAFAFPSRRPDLYQASPANVSSSGSRSSRSSPRWRSWSWLFLTWCTVTYPGLALAGNMDNLWQIPPSWG